MRLPTRCQVCGKQVNIFEEMSLEGDRLCEHCYEWVLDKPGKVLGLPWNRARKTPDPRKAMADRRRRLEFRRRLMIAVAKDEINDQRIPYQAPIKPGAYQVGRVVPGLTAYRKGPSDWLNSHVFLSPVSRSVTARKPGDTPRIRGPIERRLGGSDAGRIPFPVDYSDVEARLSEYGRRLANPDRAPTASDFGARGTPGQTGWAQKGPRVDAAPKGLTDA